MVNRIARRLVASVERARRIVDERTLPSFRNEPRGFVMQPPRSLVQPQRMIMGDDVKLGPGSRLKCSTRYPGGWMYHPEGAHVEQTFEPMLTIGSRVTATASLQITVFERVTIEDDVMFAANVFISDGTHAMDRGDVPYKYQGIDSITPVHVGRGAWIGQNVVIAPGVTVGAMAVVGSNSVVTRSVAPGTVVVGAPARAIKRWDADRAAWRPVDEPEGV